MCPDGPQVWIPGNFGKPNENGRTNQLKLDGSRAS
jgi:hypothetical protein